MPKQYRVPAILAVCFILTVFIFSTLQPTAVFSGEITVEAVNYLPLIISPEETPSVIPPGEVPNVIIDQIVYDPSTGTDLEGENVRIQNNELLPVDMTGWHLSDEVGTTFVFPEFILNSGSSVRVWVKEGTDSLTDLYWDRNRSVWNNGGDTAELKNSNSVLVDWCTYPGGSVSSSCN